MLPCYCQRQAANMGGPWLPVQTKDQDTQKLSVGEVILYKTNLEQWCLCKKRFPCKFNTIFIYRIVLHSDGSQPLDVIVRQGGGTNL